MVFGMYTHHMNTNIVEGAVTAHCQYICHVNSVQWSTDWYTYGSLLRHMFGWAGAILLFQVVRLSQSMRIHCIERFYLFRIWNNLFSLFWNSIMSNVKWPCQTHCLSKCAKSRGALLGRRQTHSFGVPSQSHVSPNCSFVPFWCNFSVYLHLRLVYPWHPVIRWKCHWNLWKPHFFNELQIYYIIEVAISYSLITFTANMKSISTLTVYYYVFSHEQKSMWYEVLMPYIWKFQARHARCLIFYSYNIWR
jgi:hypothetical protein